MSLLSCDNKYLQGALLSAILVTWPLLTRITVITVMCPNIATLATSGCQSTLGSCISVDFVLSTEKHHKDGCSSGNQGYCKFNNKLNFSINNLVIRMIIDKNIWRRSMHLTGIIVARFLTRIYRCQNLFSCVLTYININS